MSRDIKDLCDTVRVAAEAALSECKTKGYDVVVTCTYRSPDEQDKLYAQGRTIKGLKVTNAKAGQSLHQYRCALDIVPVVNGKPEWTGKSPVWKAVADIFKSHGFEWGYDWKTFKEMPHFQMTKGHNLNYFQTGGKI